MEKCYACQEETDGSLYCLHCGSLQRCLNCDHPFENDVKFCGACGSEKGKKSSEVVEQAEVPIAKEPQEVVVSQPQQTNQTPKKPLNVKMIGVVVAVIAVAAIIYFTVLDNPQKTPEDTVTLFVEAMNEKDEKKFEKIVRPSDREEVMDYVDFSELPQDAEIELLGFGEIDKESESLVDLEAKIHFSSIYLGESDSEYLDFSLLKLKNKWYIVDIY